MYRYIFILISFLITLWCKHRWFCCDHGISRFVACLNSNYICHDLYQYCRFNHITRRLKIICLVACYTMVLYPMKYVRKIILLGNIIIKGMCNRITYLLSIQNDFCIERKLGYIQKENYLCCHIFTDHWPLTIFINNIKMEKMIFILSNNQWCMTFFQKKISAKKQCSILFYLAWILGSNKHE